MAAPSNSAANLITKRIIDSGALKTGEFIRIISKTSIEREQIPEELFPYCATIDIAAPNSSDATKTVSAAGLNLNYNSFELSSHRIIISTCSTFGSLLYMNVNKRNQRGKKNHFTHVIIDEVRDILKRNINKYIKGNFIFTNNLLIFVEWTMFWAGSTNSNFVARSKGRSNYFGWWSETIGSRCCQLVCKSTWTGKIGMSTEFYLNFISF